MLGIISMSNSVEHTPPGFDDLREHEYCDHDQTEDD